MAIEAAHLTRETHARLASHELFSGLPQYNLIDRVADFRMTAALVPRRYFQYMRLLNPDFFWTEPATYSAHPAVAAG